jgi:4-aminobutyrate aminotransferase-like enzyme
MIAFAAGNAGLKWQLENKIPERAAELGEKAMKKLKAMEEKYDIVGEARGIGLMLALEMVEDSASRKPAAALAKKVRKYAHQRGAMIEVGGHHNNVARFLPPLVIPEVLLMRGLDIIEGVIADLQSGKLS